MDIQPGAASGDERCWSLTRFQRWRHGCSRMVQGFVVECCCFQGTSNIFRKNWQFFGRIFCCPYIFPRTFAVFMRTNMGSLLSFCHIFQTTFGYGKKYRMLQWVLIWISFMGQNSGAVRTHIFVVYPCIYIYKYINNKNVGPNKNAKIILKYPCYMIL